MGFRLLVNKISMFFGDRQGSLLISICGGCQEHFEMLFEMTGSIRLARAPQGGSAPAPVLRARNAIDVDFD